MPQVYRHAVSQAHHPWTLTTGERQRRVPAGLVVGGTIASDDRPIVDLVGRFNFPAFLVSGDPEPPLTEIWQAGLDARAYFDLGG